MDFHTEIRDEVFPLDFTTRYGNHSNIATLYELLAMADGPKLPAGTQSSKFSLILAMNKSHKYPDEYFLDPRINNHFAVNKEILVLKGN